MEKKLFSSESVCSGHPDKLADQISDAVLDAVLAQDVNGRVACETFLPNNTDVFVGGEITLKGTINVEQIARAVIKKVGYASAEHGLNWEDATIHNLIKKQSPDISQGVTEGEGLHKEQGAGDQGMMFGFAVNETPELMPLPLMLSHRLCEKLEEVRKNGTLTYLRPDGKAQVTVEYDKHNKPLIVNTVVVSAQHEDSVSHEQIKKDIIEHVVKPVIGDKLSENTVFHINPTGKFCVGGPAGDAGVTGRKIIVDTYGGGSFSYRAGHGGGAFCIAGDSLVNTERGLVQIKECKEIGGKGLLVKTDVHPEPAGAWYDNGLKSTEIIVTKEGYKLEATPNHNIRVIDENGNYSWKTVEEVKIGDWITIQTKNRLFGNDEIGEFKYTYKEGTVESRKKKYFFPEKLTEDYAYLMGLLIGDGDCTDEGCIKICVCEKEMKKLVQTIFKKLFNDVGKIYGHWAYIGGVELRAYLKHLGLGYSKSFEKVVPKTLFTASNKNCAAFLRGLFDTDGCIRIDGRNKNSKRIHLATTSKRLAEQVQILFLNFGIITALRAVDVTSKQSKIKGRTVISAHTRYDLTIKGSESVNLFKKNIGFGLNRKQKILETVLPKKRDLRIIPNQREKIKHLFKKLPLGEQKKDVCNISRLTRLSRGKATKELTYEKLKEFIASYEDFLKKEPDFIELTRFLLMDHYYARLEKKISSFAHTYDLNIPFSHTFTANGIVCHNSGKDPSKVDRSGAYAARYIAKNIVAANLAHACEVQLAYAIGVAEPVSVLINTFGTGKISDDVLASKVREVFPLKPAEIINHFKLKNPIFSQTASYGHFGKNNLPWEQTDKVVVLKEKLGLLVETDE